MFDWRTGGSPTQGMQVSCTLKIISSGKIFKCVEERPAKTCSILSINDRIRILVISVGPRNLFELTVFSDYRDLTYRVIL